MPPPTTIYHQLKYIHHHPAPHTTSHNTSTTTHHHPKNGLTTQQKPKYIAPFDIVLTVSFSWKFNISVKEILYDKVLIILFFIFKISSTFYVI